MGEIERTLGDVGVVVFIALRMNLVVLRLEDPVGCCQKGAIIWDALNHDSSRVRTGDIHLNSLLETPFEADAMTSPSWRQASP